MSLAQFMNNSSNGVSLETHLEQIALESNYLVNMLETFKTAIPSFTNKIRDVVSHLSGIANTQDNLNQGLTNKEHKALKIAKDLSFVGFGERIISIPENFKGSFIDYAKLLNLTATEAYQVQNTILAEYNVILSSFITNKEDRLALKDHTTFFNKIKDQREESGKKLGKFLNNKTGISKAKFRDVISRMAELEELIKVTSDLSSQHSRAKLQDIQSSVNHCVDLLDMIITGVKDGTITHISPNATMNISRGAYEIAKYVELVGIIYFDITVFLNCVDSMLEVIVNP